MTTVLRDKHELHPHWNATLKARVSRQYNRVLHVEFEINFRCRLKSHGRADPPDSLPVDQCNIFTGLAQKGGFDNAPCKLIHLAVRGRISA